MIQEGEKAPNFCLKDQFDRTVCLNDYQGKWVIIFFYRHHFGLICGKTVIEFNNKYEKFKELGVEVIGIGASEVELGKSFAKFLKVKFPLLSDERLYVAKLFDILIDDPEEKIKRCTFIIDPAGIIRKTWSYEDIDNHVNEVLETLIDLIKEKGSM